MLLNNDNISCQNQLVAAMIHQQAPKKLVCYTFLFLFLLAAVLSVDFTGLLFLFFSTPISGSLPLKMSMADWPGGLPSMGYMPPLDQVVMDGNTISSATVQEHKGVLLIVTLLRSFSITVAP